MEKKKIKLLSPKIDIVFQKLFGEVGNEKITKSFLQSILKEKIQKVDLSKNPILKRETMNDKMGILDIIVEINNQEKCNVELQVIAKENIKERILFYWSKLYARGIKQGEDYEKLSKTIEILIADFKIEGLEGLRYHSRWKIKEEEKEIVLTDKLEIHIIELPKVKETGGKREDLLDWLYFIENPGDERVIKNMEKNEGLREAKEKLEVMSDDEYMQRIAEWREKAIRDEKELLNTGYHKGMKEGMKQGEKEKRKEIQRIAKKLKEENMTLEQISKITELTIEEIEKL